MKRILSLLLVICICFCVVGCNKVTNVNSSDLSSSETNSNKNGLESTKDEKLELFHQFCHGGGQIKKIEYDLSQLGKIKDFDVEHYLCISSDGSLYEIGDFSDGTNFKRIVSNVKFVKFKSFGVGVLIISEQNDLYEYNSEDYTVTLTDYGDSSYIDYDYINSAELIDQTIVTIDGFLKNKELFLYKRGSGVLQKKPIYNFSVDEEIEYLVDGVIKTNKGYYYLEETVIESKFTDVPTTYEYNLKKIENVSDDIIFFKYDDQRIFVLDKNNSLFVYVNIGG